MAIKLRPVEAHVIDLSEVEDIDREQLKVTFEDGSVLYFGIGTSYQTRSYLVMKRGWPVDRDTREVRKLVKQFTKSFWRQRMTFSVWQRSVNWLRELLDDHYHRPTKDWTYDRLERELEVLLPLGNERNPSALRIGSFLYLEYGVRDWTPETGYAPFGTVVSIDAYTVTSQSFPVSVGNYV